MEEIDKNYILRLYVRRLVASFPGVWCSVRIRRFLELPVYPFEAARHVETCKPSGQGDFRKRGDSIMQAIQELQSAVSRLSAQELARFREWFNEFDSEAWDRQIEKDVESGKLERHAGQAIADFRAGKCKKL